MAEAVTLANPLVTAFHNVIMGVSDRDDNDN